MSSALADSCVPLPTRQTTTYDLFLSHRVQCQITNWTLGQSVSSCGDFSDECTARIYVFDRVSWILQLGVWESAGLWVESDAPKLSSVSVPGSVTSAPWERQKQRGNTEMEWAVKVQETHTQKNSLTS